MQNKISRHFVPRGIPYLPYSRINETRDTNSSETSRLHFNPVLPNSQPATALTMAAKILKNVDIHNYIGCARPIHDQDHAHSKSIMCPTMIQWLCSTDLESRCTCPWRLIGSVEPLWSDEFISIIMEKAGLEMATFPLNTKAALDDIDHVLYTLMTRGVVLFNGQRGGDSNLGSANSEPI